MYLDNFRTCGSLGSVSAGSLRPVMPVLMAAACATLVEQ